MTDVQFFPARDAWGGSGDGDDAGSAAEGGAAAAEDVGVDSPVGMRIVAADFEGNLTIFHNKDYVLSRD